MNRAGGELRWMVGAILCAAVLSSGATAQAGTYRVYTCQGPGDVYLPGPTIGPLFNGLSTPPAGWTLAGTQRYATVTDMCSTRGEFDFSLQSQSEFHRGTWFGAQWTAPAGTIISGVDLGWGAVAQHGAQLGHVQILAATDREVLVSRSSPTEFWITQPDGHVTRSGLHGAWLRLAFQCLNDCTAQLLPQLAPPLGRVLHAWIDVEDDAAPTGGLSGPPAETQVWSGPMRFGLNAGDVGGGLRRVIVQVDGADALGIPLTDARSSCSDYEPGTPAVEYLAARPCPNAINAGAVDVDASKLPRGRHQVAIALEDAAGNRSTIFGPLTRRIAAPGFVGPGSDPALRGAANGTRAADQARLTAHWGHRGLRTTKTSRFGRAHTVRGRLTTRGGAAIAGARLDVVSKIAIPRARGRIRLNGPRTRRDGRWSMTVPRRVSSRDITFRYRSHVNDQAPVATARVRLRVRAGIRLIIHPRIATRGAAIHFIGELLGRPIPRSGKQIVLTVRSSHGPWLRFNVVRTGPRGRFTATYRFKQPGQARYLFRALSLREAAYPYLSGGSNAVSVLKF